MVYDLRKDKDSPNYNLAPYVFIFTLKTGKETTSTHNYDQNQHGCFQLLRHTSVLERYSFFRWRLEGTINSMEPRVQDFLLLNKIELALIKI